MDDRLVQVAFSIPAHIHTSCSGVGKTQLHWSKVIVFSCCRGVADQIKSDQKGFRECPHLFPAQISGRPRDSKPHFDLAMTSRAGYYIKWKGIVFRKVRSFDRRPKYSQYRHQSFFHVPSVECYIDTTRVYLTLNLCGAKGNIDSAWRERSSCRWWQ